MRSLVCFTRQVANLAFAAFLGMALTSGTAQAGIMANGTINYVPFGSISVGPTPGVTLLENASSITIPATLLVNNVDATYLGLPNTFIAEGVLPLSIVSVSPLTLNVTNVNSAPTAVNFVNYLQFSSSTTPQYRFVYDMTSISWSNSPGSLSFLSNGNFKDLIGEYNSAPASVSGAFTQTGGASGSINGSFTFATPPLNVSAVPEPGSFVIVAALSGLGLLRLRRPRN
ncbi:MAG: hypothetical protein SFV81_13010 [Pirellulaceae bacterium]|nr:hypothetical protein [Pirellulaceae bacterium]